MNKKPMILAIASLGSMALIGTGFAGWVISTTATASAEGSVTAYTVIDERIVLNEASKKWDDDNATATRIIFGTPAGYAQQDNDWLFDKVNEGAGADEAMETERLQGIYSFDFWSSGTGANYEPTITLTHTVTDTAANGYAAALASRSSAVATTLNGQAKSLSGSYIDGPAIPESDPIDDLANRSEDLIDATVAEDLAAGVHWAIETYTPAGTEADPGFGGNGGTYYHATILVKFAWGGLVDNTNPYTFFNEYQGTEVTPVVTDFAKEYLEAVAAANTASFSFTVKISA